MRPSRRSKRPGMALLVVVVLIMLISLGAYRFSFYMESQYRVTRLHEEQVHARMAASSGLEMTVVFAEMSPTQRQSLGGIADNPTMFRDIAIDAETQSNTMERDKSLWRFCLVSPKLLDDKNDTSGASQALGTNSLPIRFGLENESAKLHIPTLLAWDRQKPGHARTALLGLPGVNETMVDAWLRQLGVSGAVDRSGSQDQYASLEELKQAWLGGDLNQNYQLDPIETRFASQHAGQGKSLALDPMIDQNSTSGFRPLQRYVTWTSGHRNATRNGQERIYLNDTNLQSLHRKLTQVWSPEWANFVIAMRQFGPNGTGIIPSGTAPTTSTSSPTATPTPAATPSKPVVPSPPSAPIPAPPQITFVPIANATPPIEPTPKTPASIPVGPAPTTPLSATPQATATTATNATSVAASEVQNWTPDFGKAATYNFRSPLDLVGAVVELPTQSTTSSAGQSTAATPVKQYIRNPFSSDLSEARNYLGRVLDDVTVDLSPISEGRVDATEAPLEVLAGIPGLDLATAQKIVQHRTTRTTTNESSTPQEWDTVAWLLNVVDLPKLKEIEPHLTSRSDVYSVQAIGYRDSQSAVYRTTVTIDARQTPTQLLNPKIWHPWDRGFPIEQLADSKP